MRAWKELEFWIATNRSPALNILSVFGGVIMRIQRLFVLFVALFGWLLSAAVVAQNTPDNSNVPANGQTSMPNNSQSNMVNTGQSQELVDPGVIYNDKNPGSWVDKTVTLKNVMVQDTNKDGNFWVGSDSHHRILVVKPQDNANARALQVHKGDVVTITGTVQPASKYAATETGSKKGSMHDAEDSSGVFLQASDLSVASSTQH